MLGDWTTTYPTEQRATENGLKTRFAETKYGSHCRTEPPCGVGRREDVVGRSSVKFPNYVARD